jgi:hypothetical protein
MHRSKKGSLSLRRFSAVGVLSLMLAHEFAANLVSKPLAYLWVPQSSTFISCRWKNQATKISTAKNNSADCQCQRASREE